MTISKFSKCEEDLERTIEEESHEILSTIVAKKAFREKELHWMTVKLE
jgi:hypothetical protein